ncbi:MAG: regulatory protein RecX [Desulfobacterales bacterium]|nr:regulatory protein RecX [Desulfobacterales bacterium]
MEKEAIKFRSALDTAVRILTSRSHTASELARKLKKRRIKAVIVEQVLAECKRLNYIDDEDTARLYLKELKLKGYGRRYVRSAMRKKGLAVETIESRLEQGYSNSEESTNAEKLIEKKQSTFNREEDPRKRKSKIYRYLYSRGFSPDVITQAIYKSTD